MVHAYQKGKLKNAPTRVRDIAEHISEEDAEHFAKTRHDGLPERKKDEEDKDMKKSAAYMAGFMAKCAEHGVDGMALLKSAAMGTGDDFPVPTDEAVFEYDRRRPTFSKSEPMYDFMSGNPTLAGFPLSQGVRRHREMLAERDANGAGWTDYMPLVMSGIDRYLARRPGRPGREFVDGRGREIADDMNLRASSPEAFAERTGREVDDGLRSRYDALRWGRMRPGDRGSVPSVGFGEVGDDAGSGTRSWAGPDGTLAGGMA
jgi:hypothetical protein